MPDNQPDPRPDKPIPPEMTELLNTPPPEPEPEQHLIDRPPNRYGPW